MRTIPQIRERLKVLAEEHGIPELLQLAEETRRRPPVRVAPARRRNPNEVQKAEIKAYAEAHPTQSYHDIANHFRTGHGRVSEAVAGKREEEV